MFKQIGIGAIIGVATLLVYSGVKKLCTKKESTQFSDWWKMVTSNQKHELPAFLLTKRQAAWYILKDGPATEVDLCYKVWVGGDVIYVAIFSKANGDVVLTLDDGLFQLFSLEDDGLFQLFSSKEEGEIFFESDSDEDKYSIMESWIKEMVR